MLKGLIKIVASCTYQNLPENHAILQKCSVHPATFQNKIHSKD